jgi:hypothetical protein
MEAALSPLAHEILKTGKYDKLVVTGGTPPDATKLFSRLIPDQLLTKPIKSYGHAYAMLAGLWLWHDGLVECHEIAQMDTEKLRRTTLNLHSKISKTSQNVQSMQAVENDKDRLQRQLATAMNSLSFWHAIMHRREGDFSNAKYWYHRCPNHHVMKMLAAVSSSLAEGFESDRQVKRIISGPWSPDALVDLVEEVNEKPSDPRFDLAVKLQRAEWTGLFDYCVHAAVEADRDGLDAWDKRVNS